jgi:predicted transcriptional regulator
MIKRTKLDIIKDILRLIQENKNTVRPTPLLRKSGLSSSSFKDYHAELLRMGLIKELNKGGRERKISLTEKGFKFLERYKTIIEFIEDFEL